MASRTLETVLTGTNKLSPVLAQAAKDVAAYDAAVSDANKRAGSSAEAAAAQQTSASDRVVAANEKTRQSNDRAKLSAEQMAQSMGSVQQQLGKLSSTKFEAKMDTTDARMQLTELKAKLAEIAGSDPTARVQAETDAASAQLRAVQAELNRIDGQTVNAKVNVDTDFVVLGKEPVIPTFTKEELQEPINAAKLAQANAEKDAYDAIKTQAVEFHIPILNQNRFLYFIGYYEMAQR